MHCTCHITHAADNIMLEEETFGSFGYKKQVPHHYLVRYCRSMRSLLMVAIYSHQMDLYDHVQKVFLHMHLYGHTVYRADMTAVFFEIQICYFTFLVVQYFSSLFLSNVIKRRHCSSFLRAQRRKLTKTETETKMKTKTSKPEL